MYGELTTTKTVAIDADLLPHVQQAAKLAVLCAGEDAGPEVFDDPIATAYALEQASSDLRHVIATPSGRIRHDVADRLLAETVEDLRDRAAESSTAPGDVASLAATVEAAEALIEAHGLRQPRERRRETAPDPQTEPAPATRTFEPGCREERLEVAQQMLDVARDTGGILDATRHRILEAAQVLINELLAEAETETV